MLKMFNCTAHSQIATKHALLEFGIDIELEPRVLRVRRNSRTGKVEMADLEAEAVRVARTIPAKGHCLVGGAGPLVERLSIELLRKGCHLYSITSERKTKTTGSFRFNVLGIAETPLSRSYHKGELVLV